MSKKDKTFGILEIIFCKTKGTRSKYLENLSVDFIRINFLCSL